MVHSAVGHVINRDGVEVVEAAPGESGYALFGPYCSLEPGRYKVEFHVEIPTNRRPDVNDDALCAFIDVVNSEGQRVFANKPLIGSSLKADSATHFLEFNLDAPEEGIEFRVYVTGRAPLLLAGNRQILVFSDGSVTKFSEAFEDSVEYDAGDPILMYKHNIRCDIAENAHGNSVTLGNPESASANQLRLSIRGNNNSVRLRENTLPSGTISFLGSGSTCEIVGPGPVTLELFLYHDAQFYLGKDSVVFGLAASVYNETSCYIGDGCLFANQISMWTADHHSIIDLKTRQQLNFPGDIRIGNHVWLGQGTHILKRVSIGDGSIIAARSLVNRAVPSTELWGGVPATCIRKGVSWVSSHPATEGDIATMMRSLQIQA